MKKFSYFDILARANIREGEEFLKGLHFIRFCGKLLNMNDISTVSIALKLDQHYKLDNEWKI